MSGGQRTERVAAEIRVVLGELLVRGDIKDPRVRDAGLITITHVKVTGDLQQSKVSFIVHGADNAKLERTRQGLANAAGYLRRALGDRLRLRVTPTIEFVIDRTFESEARVDALLSEIAAEGRGDTKPKPSGS